MSGGQSMQLLPAHDGATTGGSSGNTGSETIWCPQLEVGDCPTPAVGPGLSTTTARSASTAVKNISGLGALGTTLNGTFATYGNKLRSKVGSRKVNRGTIAAGNIGGAYWDLDGTDEYISQEFADGSSLDLAQGTISIWFNSDNNHNGVLLSVWDADSTSSTAYMNFATTSNWTSGYADESLIFYSTIGTTHRQAAWVRKGHGFYNDQQWHHVIYSYGGSAATSKFYIDGEYVAHTQGNFDGTPPFFNILSGDMVLEIGRRKYSGGSEEFNGKIASVMIWSQPLTQKEAKDIYIAQKGRFGK